MGNEPSRVDSQGTGNRTLHIELVKDEKNQPPRKLEMSKSQMSKPCMPQIVKINVPYVYQTISINDGNINGAYYKWVVPQLHEDNLPIPPIGGFSTKIVQGSEYFTLHPFAHFAENWTGQQYVIVKRFLKRPLSVIDSDGVISLQKYSEQKTFENLQDRDQVKKFYDEQQIKFDGWLERMDFYTLSLNNDDCFWDANDPAFMERVDCVHYIIKTDLYKKYHDALDKATVAELILSNKTNNQTFLKPMKSSCIHIPNSINSTFKPTRILIM